MRILVVGGIAASLVNFRGRMLEALAKAGHDVHACAGDTTAALTRQIENLNVRFHEVTLNRRGINFFQDSRYYKELCRIVRQVSPDVVLSYTIKPVIYGSLAAARNKTPLIAAMITGAGAAADGLTLKEMAISFVARRLYRRAFRRIHVVFFQNPDDEKLFRKSGIVQASRVVQIAGSGVDISHYEYSMPPTSPVVFLMIARLLKKKGVVEFADSALQLRRQFGDRVRFHLVGPLEAGSGTVDQSVLQEWCDDGRLQYFGALDDVRPAIRQSSVYVLPSYYGEGTPRTVLEAMAMGRPVITTDAPGCRETVIPMVNGHLVAARNVPSLLHAMREFLNDDSLIAKMGYESRRIAETKFDVNLVNATILEALGLG